MPVLIPPILTDFAIYLHPRHAYQEEFCNTLYWKYNNNCLESTLNNKDFSSCWVGKQTLYMWYERYWIISWQVLQLLPQGRIYIDFRIKYIVCLRWDEATFVWATRRFLLHPFVRRTLPVLNLFKSNSFIRLRSTISFNRL